MSDAKTRALTSAVNGLIRQLPPAPRMTPEQMRINSARWKKYSKQHSRTMARSNRDFVIARCEGCCEVCGSFQPWTMELHHIVPVKNGGIGDASNLAALCPNCHAVLEVLLNAKDFDDMFLEWLHETYGESELANLHRLHRFVR